MLSTAGIHEEIDGGYSPQTDVDDLAFTQVLDSINNDRKDHDVAT